MMQTSSAQVYRQSDEKGQVIYSDTPTHVSEEPVELPQLNEIPLSQYQTTNPIETNRKKPGLPQYQIAITSPVDNAVFSHDIPQIPVTISITPTLSHPDHYLQYYKDNEPLGELTKNSTFILENLPRGSHQLSVGIVEKTLTARGLYQTKQLTMSPPITIIQQRQHLSD
jgi:hypothetical protein